MDKKIIDQAIIHLSRDPVMKKIIESNEVPVWSTDNNLFFDLLDAIISQQLSVKAGATILKRFQDLFDSKQVPTPEEISIKPDLELRGAGLSNAKVRYVKALSQAIMDKSLDLGSLYELENDEVIEQLTKVKGIGRWTAEMFLIFSLQRPDVFSVGDLGLRSAVSKWYGIERENNLAIAELATKWSPYRSIASRYLWKSLDNEPKI